MTMVVNVGPMRGVDRGLKPVDIEELVRWTYQNQRADYIVEHGVGLHRIERAVMLGHHGSMTTDSAAMVGARLEGAAASSMAAIALHPDAEAVHEVVRQMGVLPRHLIVDHGRTGTRPDWGRGKVTRLVPVLRADGRARVVYVRDGKDPSYCPLQVLNPPDYMAGLRQRYLLWWDYLFMLNESLIGRRVLVAHSVRVPDAPRTPWIS